MIYCPSCYNPTRVVNTLHYNGKIYRSRKCCNSNCECMVHSIETKITSEKDKLDFSVATKKKNNKYERSFK